MTSATELTRPHRSATPPTLGFRRTPRGVTGWVTLLVPGSLAALVVGTVSTRGEFRFARLTAFAAAGVLGGVLIARVVDEARWRSSAVSLEVDEPDAALDLMQAIRAKGVRADMVRAGDAPTPSGIGYALRYRAKDDRRVRAVLAEQRR